MEGAQDGTRAAAEAATDPQAFLGDLVQSVNRSLPREVAQRVLEVERRRTLGDRLAGRPGAIARVRLIGETETLTLSYEPGPHWSPLLEHVYSGVVVSQQPLTLGAWLTRFAGRVAVLAGDAAGDAGAASRALQILGLQPVGSEADVRETAVEADLRAIPARLGHRMPTDAVAAVARIADLLVDTLPRVAGQGEAEVLVRRTATVYLPETLRAYLALPPDWAAGHVFPDGTTPAQALLAQLLALEDAVRRLRDAALAHDASALLANGRFLAERFSTSRLDLP